MKIAHVGAAVVTAFCLGLVVRSGDAMISVTMFVGCCAAGLAGWWLRDYEADQHERERGEVARTIERRHGTARERADRTGRPVIENLPDRGERHPFVTRPDADAESPPAGERPSPRR